MNAPKTDEGILIAKENPGLETGIHLSIVEGLSLTKKKSSVTDKIHYFNDQLCLVRDRKTFMERYLIGKIKYQELEEELELQIQAFLKHFTSIPFINGTQHLHIFPPIWKIVLKLCKKYNISAVRMPSFEKPSVLWLNKRFPFLIPFQLFGEMARVTLKNTNIQCPAGAIGMQYSGKISEDVLINILKRIPNKPIEIVMHPGYESTSLREDLPWAYSVFDWDLERKALLSGKVKDCIDQNNIQLIKFSHL